LPKNKKRKKRQKKHPWKSKHSSLADHKHVGKRVLPPMRQLDSLHQVAWLRDAFPDMLWLCSLLRDDPHAHVLECAKVLDTIKESLPAELISPPS
jgi:hypothetical protein